MSWQYIKKKERTSMEPILIRIAKETEINWINSKYQEVEFVKSDFKNEFIVITEYNNIKSGIGRLVALDKNNIELGGIYVFPGFRKLGIAEKIVSFLLDNNPYEQSVIWCLPFENLLSFYSRFGFTKNYGEVPEKILNKYQWCNTNGLYDKKVLLLSKRT